MDICLGIRSLKLVLHSYILVVREVGYIAIGAKIFSGILVQTIKPTITMVAIEGPFYSRTYIACNRVIIVFVIGHLLAPLVKPQR